MLPIHQVSTAKEPSGMLMSCYRVREGGEMLDELKVDRRIRMIFSGADGAAQSVTTAQWFGVDKMNEIAGIGQMVPFR